MAKNKNNWKSKEQIANRAHDKEKRDIYKSEGTGIPGRESL